MSIVVASHRLVFLHVPRTGGSSVTAQLWPLVVGGEAPPDGYQSKGWHVKAHAPETGLHVAPKAKQAQAWLARGYRIACGVRNPWERAVSLYGMKAKGSRIVDKGNPSFRYDWASITESFAAFCARLPTIQDLHTPPQWGFAKHATHWLRFESLQHDWDELCAEVGLPRQPLPHRHYHNRVGPPPWVSMHDARTVDLVRQAWPNDCARLGYQPPAVAVEVAG